MFAFRNRFHRGRLSLSTLQTALQPGKDKEEDFVSVKEEQTYSTNHSRRNRRSVVVVSHWIPYGTKHGSQVPVMV